MSEKQRYDWIEDPFNDEKSEEELREATRSRNRGCLLVAACMIVVMLIAVGAVVLSLLNLVA